MAQSGPLALLRTADNKIAVVIEKKPLARNSARIVLVCLAVLLVWGIWRPLPRHGSAAPEERTDSASYWTIIERLARGESYYPVVGAELRERDYPSGSVFNWRLPTLALMLAHARVVSFGLLVVLVAGVLFGTVRFFYSLSPEIMLFALLMQIGAAASAFNPLAFVLHETWAGLCIALSALLYAFKRFTSAAVIIVASLFIRELVAPYALACGLVAIYHRRRSEAVVFVAGGIAWLSFYAWHAMKASEAMTAGALEHPSWIQWGGPRFVLATIGFGGWLYLLPPWVAAVAATLLVASLWSPIEATHVKIAAFSYVLFFMIAGQQFNQYWGLLAAPTWTICYGLGAAGLVRLVRSAFPEYPKPLATFR
jgi:hypothetical protein